MPNILTLLAFFFLLGSFTSPHANALSLTEAEQEWLKAHPLIRFSGPQSFPPFQYFDNDGVFKGIATDYLHHLAGMVGLQVEVAGKMAWPEVLKNIENMDIDVLSCAAYSQARSAYLNYTTPHLSFPLVIVTRTDGPFISDLQSLDGKILAFVKNSITIDKVNGAGIDILPRQVDSPLMALQEVSLNKADATIQNLAAATYLIDRNGLANLKIAAPTSFENYTLSIAVRKDWPELVSIFNKGLAAMDQKTHNEIRQRWLSVRYEHGLRVRDIVYWVLAVTAVAALLIIGFVHWNRKLAHEILERKKAEQEKERLIAQLQHSLEEIKTLRGILPICSRCKKIRDDQGYWTQIEEYINLHSEADFSHGICPGCYEKIYGDEPWFGNVAIDPGSGKTER